MNSTQDLIGIYGFWGSMEFSRGEVRGLAQQGLARQPQSCRIPFLRTRNESHKRIQLGPKIKYSSEFSGAQDLSRVTNGVISGLPL